MFGAMMTAATGLHHQQRRMDTIAHNIANVNTTAFRGVRTDFRDALYQNGITPARPRTPEGNQQRGHGVMLAGLTRDFRGGSILTTERNLDVAIEGEGFFALRDYTGNTVYTRNGAFNISVEADGNYLVNHNGLYVLDVNDERIQIPDVAETIIIGTDGSIRFTNDAGPPDAMLAVYTFRNLKGLLSDGGGVYTESEASGERFEATNAVLRQGAIEGSNVDLSEELTRMIRTQRALQLASRALTTADEMEGIANNMRR